MHFFISMPDYIEIKTRTIRKSIWQKHVRSIFKKKYAELNQMTIPAIFLLPLHFRRLRAAILLRCISGFREEHPESYPSLEGL